MDYFDSLLGWERFRASQFGIAHYCAIGLNSKEANNEPLAREVLELLPRFALKEGVVAIGEIGFDEITPAEERAYVQQVEFARDHDMVVMVHSPHRDKKRGTIRTIEVVRRAGFPEERVLIDHNNEETLASVLDSGFYAFRRSFDPRHGGFGGAPKFPRVSVYNFLLRYYHRTGNAEALDMVYATLNAMAHGGIHDHLGGGFHRYSVDERGTTALRGNDAVGAWEWNGKEVVKLGVAKETEQAWEQFQRHLGLAQQLVRFLDPGALVEALEQPSEITTGKLQWSRAAQPECRTLEGTLPSMPLYFSDGIPKRVRAKLFVDAATNLLGGIYGALGNAQGAADLERGVGDQGLAKLLLAGVALVVGVGGIWLLYIGISALVGLLAPRWQGRIIPWVFVLPAIAKTD